MRFGLFLRLCKISRLCSAADHHTDGEETGKNMFKAASRPAWGNII